MDQLQARDLGRRLRERRQQIGLSTRELAERASTTHATVVRLEQGAFNEPRPDKLQAVALALGINVADIFELAAYTVPTELLMPYLRAQHRNLPPAALAELQHYAEQLASRYGIDPAGPAPGEDETPAAKKRKR
jgi:transcriptional regulator with XRE-family HTH domain